MTVRCCGVLRDLWILTASLTVIVSPLPGQTESGPPATLQIFRRLAFEIGSDLAVRLDRRPGPVTGVAVLPREVGLPLEEDLVRGFGVPEAPSARRDSAGLHLELVITEARAFLENSRREGFFGPRLADRVVVLTGRAKTWVEGIPPQYVDLTRAFRDTVRLSAVESLENPSLGFTRITIPSQGFFDNLLEPIVVLGAVGVAVYLLFAVRT